MDLVGDIRRHTLDILLALTAEGALPSGIDLARFSVRVPGAGAPRGRAPVNLLVDAAFVYAREAAAGGLGRDALASALAGGLRQTPRVAAAAVVGGGLVAVTLRPEAVLAAVSAMLSVEWDRGPSLGATRAHVRSPGLDLGEGAGPAAVAASLLRARSAVSAEILASLARATGSAAADGRGGAVPAAPVVLRGSRSGREAGAHEGGADAWGEDAGAVLAWIGADSFRFAVASHRRDAVLDLDPSRLGERSRGDPAFWVAYAHARCRRTLRRAASDLPGLDLSPSALAAADLSRLSDAGEIALARLIVRHQPVVTAAAVEAAPHALAAHLRQVADAVHAQWNRSKDQPQLRFVNEEQRDLTKARLALVTASALVLRSGLGIFGSPGSRRDALSGSSVRSAAPPPGAGAACRSSMPGAFVRRGCSMSEAARSRRDDARYEPQVDVSPGRDRPGGADPLAELARLVGHDDPFRAVFRPAAVPPRRAGPGRGGTTRAADMPTIRRPSPTTAGTTGWEQEHGYHDGPSRGRRPRRGTSTTNTNTRSRITTTTTTPILITLTRIMLRRTTPTRATPTGTTPCRRGPCRRGGPRRRLSRDRRRGGGRRFPTCGPAGRRTASRRRRSITAAVRAPPLDDGRRSSARRPLAVLAAVLVLTGGGLGGELPRQGRRRARRRPRPARPQRPHHHGGERAPPR